MTNILTDTLPTTITLNGRAWRVRHNFQDCLRAVCACEDAGLTVYEKHKLMVENVFINLPDDLAGARRAASLFLNGGEVTDPDDAPLRLFSFSKDAGLIFSAFRQTHNIDLQSAALHWWVWLALFMDLGSDTAFVNLVALRKRVKTGKASKEEREAAREMGERFDLPEFDDRTLAERDAAAEFMRLIQGGK